MPSQKTTLANRQLRTRKDLLQAAKSLLHSGHELNMDSIAKEALVSRATAYRYFSDIDEIMTEVAIDASVPDSKEIFRDAPNSTVIDRLDYAEAHLHNFVYTHERQLRILLSKSIAKPISGVATIATPVRQNRRSEYIEEAVGPYRPEFDTKTLKKLCEALALVFGPEAMVVFRDVVPLEPNRAREVKRWMIATLVKGALQESRELKRKKKS